MRPRSISDVLDAAEQIVNEDEAWKCPKTRGNRDPHHLWREYPATKRRMCVKCGKVEVIDVPFVGR